MSQNIPLVDLRVQFEPLREEIFSAWNEVLSSMRLFLGPNVQKFEQEFAAYCGSEFAIGVSSGTDAINLALRAANIGPGDEVITVSHTFIATAEAILLAGAKPVFVDIQPDTCLMNVGQIEQHITEKTRAILPVHLYGQCVDMDPILTLAQQHNLIVIEDACQAHGATYKGRRAGSMGTFGTFSFYFTKNLGAYGEGGMITTSDPEMARRLRMLRDHGSETRYYHEMVGVNGRLDELQAAALLIKLKYLDDWNQQRRRNAAVYQEMLGGSGIITPTESDHNTHVYHLYVIRTPYRDRLREFLGQQGIGTGIHYPVPIHLQSCCENLGYHSGDLPITEAITQEILSLPMYPELTHEQIRQVAAGLHAFLAEPVGGS